jgi:hypothetical protein
MLLIIRMQPDGEEIRHLSGGDDGIGFARLILTRSCCITPLLRKKHIKIMGVAGVGVRRGICERPFETDRENPLHRNNLWNWPFQNGGYDARIRRESGVYVTQMLHAKFEYDVRHAGHVHANVARTSRARSAQHGMLLWDPSVVTWTVDKWVEIAAFDIRTQQYSNLLKSNLKHPLTFHKMTRRISKCLVS